MVSSGLVYARKIFRFRIYRFSCVSLWSTWHLCLYICEKREMSHLWHTDGRTDEQWKVEQYSVWAEYAIKMAWQTKSGTIQLCNLFNVFRRRTFLYLYIWAKYHKQIHKQLNSHYTAFFLARVRYFSCRLFSWKGYSPPEAKSDTPSTHRDGNVWFDSRWITNATDFIP